MWLSVCAVSLGAAVGANARWALSLWLNSEQQMVPLGTLLANLLGSWLAGLLIGYFSGPSALAPEWRLFAITGLCGALTTFSTFSLEMFAAIQNGKWMAALAGGLVHVAGTLLMVALGLYTFSLLRG
ncbi:fluoride efflux transporter CrcB [Marinobacter sp. X15-166B]|uniref:fluoride efflux transporter CrcB n=1 Tax=Marinobacter sp. X15-166B TaxID=1897620 RepID=UPI00085C5E46|nr:fluoride efflux transporter CrcB [Marinobacter sp. X15-166B]OEY65772.1 fluoride ion transporter CrcB [Marinobacter sp. X15-166B]